jgi:hypothetical protein
MSSETFEDYDTFPEVFQNNIKFVDNKLSLFIKYETMVVNKTQMTSLTAPVHYSHNCPYKDTIELCRKYNVKLDFVPLLDHLYYLKTEKMVPVVVCNNSQTTLLGKCFTNDSKDSIVCKPFDITILGKEYSIYIDTTRSGFSDECSCRWCSISNLNEVLKVKHFHSQAILTDGTNTYSTDLTILEYKNIELFKNYSDIFNMNYNKQSPIDITFDIVLHNASVGSTFNAPYLNTVVMVKKPGPYLLSNSNTSAHRGPTLKMGEDKK